MWRRLFGGSRGEKPAPEQPARAVAVDWSGALAGARRKIWVAEAAGGRLTRLENGRTREEVAEYLVAEAGRNPAMVVGFDFAFSLPAWFLEERGMGGAAELWNLAEREAEGWLARCEPPFWGRPGKGRPVLELGRDHFRRTDLNVPGTGGIRPKSVFQIGGAGAVGTGSLRGMPVLGRLSGAGFSVWPFDAPGWPRVVEIYPRALTGRVIKSDERARRAYLRRHFPEHPADLLERAASSEDAFDAAVSALVMACRRRAPPPRPRARVRRRRQDLDAARAALAGETAPVTAAGTPLRRTILAAWPRVPSRRRWRSCRTPSRSPGCS